MGLYPETVPPLGTVILKCRLNRNLSQAELGGLVGLSQPKISQIESNTLIPEMKYILRMLNVFECSLEMLLKAAENNCTPKEMVKKEAEQCKVEVARLNKLLDCKQRQIDAMMEEHRIANEGKGE